MSTIELLEARKLLAASPWGDVIDNPLFPLFPGTTWVYKGTTEDGETEKVITAVTNETRQIQGVRTTVVLDKAYISGELVEKTYDFYAQDRAGNVWYFGEQSYEYEDGLVVSKAGSFEAGVNGARAGIIMLAHPRVGDAYRQEQAVGVAEDEGEVIALAQTIETPFATFGNCLKTRDFTKLEPGIDEQKFYAPGIGFVLSESSEGDVLRLQSVELGAAAFQGVTIDNPYFPLIPGTTYVYKGTSDGEVLKNIVTVTQDTRRVAGVDTTVVLDKEYENSELTEKTYDFYAQDRAGNVWYFGESSYEYEDNLVVGKSGSFEAGVNGAKAGIIMPAQPNIGSAYREEGAPGVAEDEARVLSLTARVVTPFATFGECLQTENTNPLEPGAIEHKFYAPGFGLVFAEDVEGGDEVLRLSSIDFVAPQDDDD